MNSLSNWRMLITICGILASGCEKETLITESSITDRAFEVKKANVVRENLHFPIEFTAFVMCAGEEIHFTGALHLNSHTVLDGNGGFHSVFTLNDHSLSGVGLTTGTKYHEVGATVEVFNVRGTAPLEYTFTNTLNIIGQGPGNNLIIKQNFHLTINANGSTTAIVDNFTLECR